MCKLPKRYRRVKYCRLPLPKNINLKNSKKDLKITEYEKLLSKRVYCLNYIDVLLKRFIVGARKNFFKCMGLVDQKFKFGGTIGYWDSHLELLFRHFKVFRLRAILHDAAGAMQSHSGNGLGYCCMIGRGRKSCLLGHVIGLEICFCIKLFLPSIFNSVGF